MLLLLEPLERATRYLLASFYSTMGDTHLVFTGIQTHLDKYANDNNFTANEVAALISSKIKKYWLIMDNSSTISAILDTRSKLSVFSEKSKPSACAQIQSIFELYKEQSYSSTNLVPSTPVKKNRQYFTRL